MNDQIIVDALRTNPRRAVELILEKYGDALLGNLLHLVGRKEVAEDLLQETFVKVWNNAASYDASRGRVYTWLLNIARHTALDKLRTQKYNRHQKSLFMPPTVSNSAAWSEEMKTSDVGLHQQINKLDEKYRQIIDLVYLNGYTQSEVTEALGIPLGTVKSRVKIAIRELRKFLDVKK